MKEINYGFLACFLQCGGRRSPGPFRRTRFRLRRFETAAVEFWRVPAPESLPAPERSSG